MAFGYGWRVEWKQNLAGLSGPYSFLSVCLDLEWVALLLPGQPSSLCTSQPSFLLHKLPWLRVTESRFMRSPRGENGDSSTMNRQHSVRRRIQTKPYSPAEQAWKKYRVVADGRRRKPNFVTENPLNQLKQVVYKCSNLAVKHSGKHNFVNGFEHSKGLMTWKRKDGEAGSSVRSKQWRRVEKESDFLSYAETVTLHSLMHSLWTATHSRHLKIQA